MSDHTPEQIKEFHQQIDDLIAHNGWTFINVMEIGTYSVGLTPKAELELFTIGTFEHLPELVDELVAHVGSVSDLGTLGPEFISTEFEVRDDEGRQIPMRVRIKEITDPTEQALVRENLILAAVRRFGSDQRLIQIVLPDTCNRLPDEVGYDSCDQSIEVLKAAP